MEVDRFCPKRIRRQSVQFTRGNETDEMCWRSASRFWERSHDSFAWVTAPEMTSGVFERARAYSWFQHPPDGDYFSRFPGLVENADDGNPFWNSADEAWAAVSSFSMTIERVNVERNPWFIHRASTRLPEWRFRFDPLFIESVDKLFDENREDKIHHGGTKNISRNRNFETAKTLKTLLSWMKIKTSLFTFSKDDPKSGLTTVTIGEESKIKDLKGLQCCYTNYTVGDLSGTIGVLGPKRMEYSKMILWGLCGKNNIKPFSHKQNSKNTIKTMEENNLKK